MDNLSIENIKKNKFPKSFRGYDIAKVDEFIEKISTEWDLLVTALDDSHTTVEDALVELEKYKKKERSIQSAIIAAEKIAEETIENSRTEAEKIIEEAKEQAKNIIKYANSKSVDTERTLRDNMNLQYKFIEQIQQNQKMFMESWRNFIAEEVSNIKTLGTSASSTETTQQQSSENITNTPQLVECNAIPDKEEKLEIVHPASNIEPKKHVFPSAKLTSEEIDMMMDAFYVPSNLEETKVETADTPECDVIEEKSESLSSVIIKNKENSVVPEKVTESKSTSKENQVKISPRILMKRQRISGNHVSTH